jgi:hypothetical protein
MFDKFLAWLDEKANKQHQLQQPVKLAMAPTDGKEYWWIGGKVIEKVPEAPLRKHTFFDLDGLIEACGIYANDNSQAWINDAGMSVVLDDATDDGDGQRRNALRLEWVTSELWKLVKKCAEKDGLVVDQKGLIRLLKTTLSQVPEQPTLLPIVRNIRWSQSVDSKSQVGPGDESLGKDLQRRLITGGGQMPETISARVQPIINGSQSSEGVWPLCIHLEPVPENERFLLYCEPDEVREVWVQSIVKQTAYFNDCGKCGHALYGSV